MAKSKAPNEYYVMTSKFSQTKFNLSLLLFCAAAIAFFWPIVAEIFLGIYVTTASAEPIMYFAILWKPTGSLIDGELHSVASITPRSRAG